MLVQDTDQVGNARVHEYLTALQTHAFLAVPLLTQGKPVGLLAVDNATSGRPIPETIQDLLFTIGAQIASAVDSARLYQTLEQRVAERTAEARESERRLTDIIEFLPDATLVIDSEGRVIAWNRAIEAMTGIAAAEMLGKGDYEYAIPFYGERRPILVDLVFKPQEELERKYAQIQRSGETLIGENYVPHLQGSGRYLFATASVLRDARGTVVGAIETIRDITERKQAEDALQQSEARYHLLAEIGEALSSPLDMQSLFGLIARATARVMHVGTMYIALYDEARHEIEFVFSDNLAEVVPGTRSLRGYESDGLSCGTANRSCSEAIPSRRRGGWGLRSSASRPPHGWACRCLGDRVLGAIAVAALHRRGYLQRFAPVTAGSRRQPGGHCAGKRSAVRRGTAQKQYLQQAQQAEREQRVLADTLREAAAALTRTLDLDAALETLLESLHQLVPYDSASVMLLEDATHLAARARRGFGEWKAARLTGKVWDVESAGALRQVLHSRQSLLIPDVREFPGWKESAGTAYIRSWLGVPLISGGEVIGLYSMDKAEVGFFTAEHARLAEMLADHGAVAIEHARLLRDLQASNRQLQGLVTEHETVRKAEHEQRVLAEALRDISVMLTSSLNLGQVFEGILNHVAHVVPFDASSILFIKGELVEVAYVRGFQQSIIGLQFPLKRPNLLSILETGQPVVIDDTRIDDGWVETPETSWIRSDLSAAIRVGEEIIGFLSLDSGAPYAFTAEHVERLQTFASQTAIALQNARLYSGAQREKQYFESLVSNNPAAVVVADKDGIVLSWNPAAESLFGYPRNEAIGRNIDDLVANDAVRAEAAGYTRQAGTGNAAHAITRRNRRDDSLVDVELHAVPVIIEGKQVSSLAIYHDISELQQAQQAERKQRVLAETLRDAGAALTRALDLDAALETLLDTLRQLVPYDSACVMLLEDATHLAIRAERGFERWTAAPQIGLTFDTARAGALRQVLQSRSPC